MMGANGHDAPRRVVRIIVSFDWLAQKLQVPPAAIQRLILPLETRFERHLFVEVAMPQGPEVLPGQLPPLVTLEYPVVLKPYQDTGLVVPQ